MKKNYNNTYLSHIFKISYEPFIFIKKKKFNWNSDTSSKLTKVFQVNFA
jgi:hypothetical protein